MREFSRDEQFAAAKMAQADLYFFSRWMFFRRRRYKWQRAPHHKVICDALMRVFHGECKRLIINIPPRYSKTELLNNFIAWSAGHAPDSEYILTSYAAQLAGNNSWQIREMVQHPEYQAIFPGMALRPDSAARHEWRTTAGGIVYSAGAGGTITGYGAGKHREGFGGCFPSGTRVWTEGGLLPIDRIVRERLRINVWSFDYDGHMVLRPVTAWHENPPNDIVRITFDDGEKVECTPDHRFWTENRGWVRADSLGVEDRLPSVQGSVKRTDDVGIDAQCDSGRFNAFSILPSGSALPVGDGVVGLLAGELGPQVGPSASLSNDIDAAGDRLPRFASPNLKDDGGADAVGAGDFFGRHSGCVVDRQSLLVGKHGAGVHLGFTESAMLLAVNDICGAGVVPEIAESVVAGVAVRMAHVGALGLVADKGQHDQLVNIENLGLGTPGQVDSEVTLTIIAGLEDSFGLDVFRPGARNDAALASYTPKVTDRVEPFISGHRKPVLVERVRHDDVTFCLTVDEYHNFTVESGLVVKNCIIIDDPHKADEARSDVIRQNVIDWFQNTLESRKNSPDTPIIVIMQRLHEDDLSGWLLNGGNGEEWEHVCLPAIQTDGTALWPQKHDMATLRRMEQAAPYVFAGQYMQRPSPLDGGIFKPGMLQVVDALPAERIQWVRGWDFGATETGDPSAGAKIGRLQDGRFVVADMFHETLGPDDRDAALKNTASQDGFGVRISIPQDPGQAGKTQVLYLTRMLQGYRVHSSPESGDKVTRAEPFAAQVNVGNVLMLRGSWNKGLIEEMRMFPNGRHDDRIDACSRAFSLLITRGQMKIHEDLLKRQ